MIGTCKYCGGKCGFFSTRHEECEQKHSDGLKTISQTVSSYLSDPRQTADTANKIKSEVNQVAAASYITNLEEHKEMLLGFGSAVNNLLEKSAISSDEEEKLNAFRNETGLSQNELDVNHSWEKVVKSTIIRDLHDGKVPERMKVDVLPFLLDKNEKVIWIFVGTQFYEQTTHTQYIGGSSCASIRIVKGVYYHVGAFKGHSVKTTNMEYKASGIMCLTNHNIYFSSDVKNLKIPYQKLITLEPFEDGIKLQRDGTSAKPMCFSNIDGWFASNVVGSLRGLE